ncbi:MAG: MerR family transcriptional regulator [Terriglobia bacterium]
MTRAQQSRAAHHTQSSSGEIVIPDKLYFRIGEVSRLTATKTYVLRYWETEFPTLKPVKSRSGHRLYRRQDLETVVEIKKLLYGKGFTIEGARKQLASPSAGDADGAPPAPAPQRPQPASALDGQQLRAIQRELQGILTILSGK